MRIVIQRVSEAEVKVEGVVKGSISRGLTVLLGIETDDTDRDVDWLVNKLVNLRVFDDSKGVMNHSLLAIEGELLVISQFTLMASSKKGNRPFYIRAAKQDIAFPLYEKFLSLSELKLRKKVASGVFGVNMKLELINDGPVTLILDSKNRE